MPSSSTLEAGMLEDCIVRYGDLKPCKTAFIDAHTPGSDQKENFTIIGGGVSESPDQHVHLNDKIGFNIGAAGQPPRCKNSLHSHTTAEVFFVLKGRWRFFWGRWGTAGEVVLEEGDIFNIPTGIFRGFENIGSDYGMIMAVLGGDDAGGGVTWAPQVLEEAQSHGLVLGADGRLYDTKKGEALPAGVEPMPLLTEAELKAFPESAPRGVVRDYIARYSDLVGLATDKPVRVIGEEAVIRDKPGFEIDFLTRGSVSDAMCQHDKPTVLMPMRGQWRIKIQADETVLNPGDTCLIHAGRAYALAPATTDETSLYRVRKTDDKAGATWQG